MWTRLRKKRQVRAAPFECRAQKLLRNSPQPSHTDMKSQVSLALETMVATSGANRFLGKEGGEGGREEERTCYVLGTAFPMQLLSVLTLMSAQQRKHYHPHLLDTN